MKPKHINITIKTILLFTILIFFSRCMNVYASVKHADIIYFYITVCEPCSEAKKEMIKISRETAVYNPNIIMYNIENKANLELLNQYYDYYKIPQENRHLPCAFVGKTYLANEDGIDAGLKTAITRMDTATPLLKKSAAESNIKQELNGFMIAGSFAAGLVNGFNPCALSMLLFFISLLLAQRGNILKTGLAFCLGKFLMFLALGTVLFGFLSVINLSVYKYIVKVLLLALIVIVTMLNASDYIAAKNEQYGKVRMQLPVRLRKKMNSIINRMVKGKTSRYIVLISFLTGTVITIGEFLCTGQLYLAAIIYSIRQYGSLNGKALTALLIYDIGFILPLLVLVAAIHRGRLIFDLSESLRNKLPLIKLITASAFLIYGLIFLFLL